MRSLTRSTCIECEGCVGCTYILSMSMHVRLRPCFDHGEAHTALCVNRERVHRHNICIVVADVDESVYVHSAKLGSDSMNIFPRTHMTHEHVYV